MLEALSIAYSLACTLGYKNVIFVGLSLILIIIFFRTHPSHHLTPTLFTVLDELMSLEQAFVSKLYNLENPLYNDKHSHFTVSNKISRTLDITKIISISSQHYKKINGTNTYLFHSTDTCHHISKQSSLSSYLIIPFLHPKLLII